ncbi:MAG TPA: DNA alkylation repair protein [Candidatus Saccharimonadales bacterium]|nr:DNA alkylation repair protein [Candidatus Saccharimonadales bacterium]
MATVASIMAELKKRGRAGTRRIYARHGMATDNMYGVSIADLKIIFRKIKGDQELALALFATGNVDAMYLAGMVADGSKMSKRDLCAWAEGAAGLQMIAEYTVPWVAVENAGGRELALQWMKSTSEHVASTGWCTYSGLLATTPDEKLDLAEIETLIGTVVSGIAAAQNRVRYTMNGFLMAVGSYVKPLLRKAKAAAKQIGNVSVDVGETACRVPVAAEYIDEMEAKGRTGKKRKTIRC